MTGHIQSHPPRETLAPKGWLYNVIISGDPWAGKRQSRSFHLNIWLLGFYDMKIVAYAVQVCKAVHQTGRVDLVGVDGEYRLSLEATRHVFVPRNHPLFNGLTGHCH
ncbi:hypothetical protein RF55_25008 [Lasius niger]|uniref:Uncharacterized protein n=1 Tax=Lasius niger TaxID=67767 RepID=A0A0J7JU97_LASNI|nr:hypothetical protein RF55_25008 [Lasius niger]